METETVTRAIICPLETSRRKVEYFRECIDEWQEIARFTANRLRSFDRYDVNRNNPQVGKITREWDKTISAAVAQEAAYKAVEAYQSWFELGQPGEPPIGEFGDGEYLRIRNQQITIEENDRGFGVKLNLIPYSPEWFHISPGEYHEEWLSAVIDADDPARHGSAEVYLRDNDNGDPKAYLHLTVVSEVEVVVPDSVERWVGVDLGENVIYSMASVGVNSDEIEDVNLMPGKEYRHHREQLKRKRMELGEKGDLRGVRRCKGDIEKYTEWVLHTASKEIVEYAAGRRPCGIKLETLTGYRSDRIDPIHDWPYAKLQEYICYKATAAGVPVTFIDAQYTSQLCNRCGQEGVRDRSSFECGRCDYEVHADVNAAINIARK